MDAVGIASFFSHCNKKLAMQEKQIFDFLSSFLTNKLAFEESVENDKRKHLSPLRVEGRCFCITGLTCIPRFRLWELIEKAGGKVARTVSDKVDVLIAGALPGPKKIELARQLNLSICGDIPLIFGLAQELDVPVEDILDVPPPPTEKANTTIRTRKNKKKEYAEGIDNKDKMTIKDRKICITGTLDKPRKKYIEKIEKAGGIFCERVTRDLDYLVCGENVGKNKTEKAKLYGTGIRTLSALNLALTEIIPNIED